jgi:hypothetical protein
VIHSGAVTFIQRFGDALNCNVVCILLAGSQHILVWSAPDRSYFLFGSMSEAEAVAIANSVR